MIHENDLVIRILAVKKKKKPCNTQPCCFDCIFYFWNKRKRLVCIDFSAFCIDPAEHVPGRRTILHMLSILLRLSILEHCLSTMTLLTGR